jgi:hypothetical protein
MTRLPIIGNLVQAAIFGAGAWWLGQRWALPMGIAILCSGLQIGAAVAILRGKPALARWASVLTLVGLATVIGLYWNAAQHLQEAYGGDARKFGKRSQWTALAAVPWFGFFPLCQAVAGGRLRLLFLPLLALLLCTQMPGASPSPVTSWSAQPQLEAAAQAAFALWRGGDAAVPAGHGPAVVLLTPWIDGKAGQTVRGAGEGLDEAVQAALHELPAPTGQRQALVLDLARRSWPRGRVSRATESGGLGAKSGSSPSSIWHRSVKARGVLPMWRLPTLRLSKSAAKKQLPTDFDSVIVDASGPTRLTASWSAPPELTAESALAAALAGGRMLVHHQSQTGKYAYTVQGPSGKVRKKGYNFPRHAGTTWFLARLAARTGDPEIVQATQAGLAFMVEHSTQTRAGGAYLHDPKRKDGKTWAGTTALAALAADAAGHPIAADWGRFLASTVDEAGQVRGNVRMDTELAPEQPKNPYGQGQVVLALATLVKSGQDELRPALLRAAAYMDGDYAPGAVGRLLVLDEHWTCLAALATRDALGTTQGAGVCRGYLAAEAHQSPDPTQRMRPHSGAAGGLAEAVIAGAMLDPDGPWRDQALRHGQGFLRNQYKPADSPFLGRPEALIGGFRDNPGRLAVRMDAVQHIGCALLGIETLLAQPTAGSLP